MDVTVPPSQQLHNGPGLMMVFPLESEGLKLLAQGPFSLDISLYAPQDLVFVSAIPLSRKLYKHCPRLTSEPPNLASPIQGSSISEIQNLGKQNKRL